MRTSQVLARIIALAITLAAALPAAAQTRAPGTEYFLGPTLGKQWDGADAYSSGVNAQTGTSYIVTATDSGKLITFSNASPVAVTLPRAGGNGFEANKKWRFNNTGAGAVTITPTTSTICGSATLVLAQSTGADVYSNGTNYICSVNAALASGVVASGGTGRTTLTAHSPLIGEGTSAVGMPTPGATGEVFVGQTGADPVFTATPSGLTSLGATTLNGTTVNAGADATAGTIQVFPATTARGKTTLTAADNAGATTTNINTAAQAGARTYTVPDAGGSAAFMMTGATQSATTGLPPTPLPMTGMRTAAGLMMTGSASSTNFGLTYTPGTTALLVGTATSSNSTSNVAAIDVVLPPWYKAGTNITLKVGCYYTEASGSTTVHTMAADAYLNTVAGLQGSSLIATAAQVCPITTSAQQTFTITGATLVPGSYLTLTFTAAVDNATGAATEFLTSAVLN